MIPITEYARRRKELMKKIDANSIVILSASPAVIRNHDHEYLYRQNSDFYYLTGFKEPEAVMVLLSKNKSSEFILFNRKRDREKEIWDGHRAGQAGARQEFGADTSFPIDELEKKLPELIAGREKIYYAFGACAAFDKIISQAINTVRNQIRNNEKVPSMFADIRPFIHEMRLIKSAAEIKLMRKAAEISADAHKRVMEFCKPGLYEYQLEAEITHEFQRQGARCHAYNPIVGSGENTCILHYVNNDKQIKKGSMVLIDAGAEYNYYASDVTRTFPADGHFTQEQRAIYEIVLEAQLAGIKAIKPHAPWNQVDIIVTKIITQGLIDVGLLKGKLDDLIEKQAYSKFYMHRSGHWLGLDTHDAGRYKINDKWRKMEPGMVRTVEPGIYISAETPGVHKRWHNIGVRIEDDVLVTQKGHDVLSHGAPKKIDDIEKLMTTK